MKARLCRSRTGRGRTGTALANIALGGAAVLALAGCTSTPVSTPTSTPSASNSVVDPSIPTPTPSVATSSAAATPSSTPTPSATATVAAPTKKKVSPFITSAAWDSTHSELDVSAIVSNIVEQDGACTLTATRAGITRTVGAPASASAQSTGCQPLTLPGSQLAAGTWSVTVTYSSAKSMGVSAARQVQVTK